jgi:hypothetical protein
MGMNKIKAITDKIILNAPVVRVRAYVISNEETTISPIATNEAHILSKLDMLITPIPKCQKPMNDYSI